MTWVKHFTLLKVVCLCACAVIEAFQEEERTTAMDMKRRIIYANQKQEEV